MPCCVQLGLALSLAGRNGKHGGTQSAVLLTWREQAREACYGKARSFFHRKRLCSGRVLASRWFEDRASSQCVWVLMLFFRPFLGRNRIQRRAFFYVRRNTSYLGGKYHLQAQACPPSEGGDNLPRIKHDGCTINSSWPRQRYRDNCEAVACIYLGGTFHLLICASLQRRTR